MKTIRVDGDDLPDSLKEMLGGIAHHIAERHGDEAWKCKLGTDVQVMRLTEVADAYQEAMTAPRFKAGDFVTPLEQHGIKGAGQPHVVLEILSKPNDPIFLPEHGSSPKNGVRNDMRVCTFVGDETLCYWVESWQYVPWKG